MPQLISTAWAARWSAILLHLALALASLAVMVGPSLAQSIPPPVMPGDRMPCSPEPPAVEQAIWTSYYAGTQVWGYVDRHSRRRQVGGRRTNQLPPWLLSDG